MVTTSQLDNPFRGLSPFEADEAHLYFGRTEQIKELSGRLQQHRFIAVLGASGSGKSSLVRAGLIPILERSLGAEVPSRWRVAIMRPGSDPVVQLAAALRSEFPEDEPELVLTDLQRSNAGLARFARRNLDRGESLLLVVDQFEELFRYQEGNNDVDGADQTAAFVKLLLAASGHSSHPLPHLTDVPVYIVITMRSDFLGDCTRFRGLPEALNETQYLVPRLTREQQREVIEGPIRLAKASIAPALVQRLLNDAGDEPDQLPVLQHALMRTWEASFEARERGEEIAIEHYDAVGRLANALNHDADEALALLNHEQAAIARRLFQRLVEVGPRGEKTRRPTPLSEIVAVTTSSESEVREVIEVFRSRGFVVMSSYADSIIDITHESLIRCWSRLKEWVQEELESATMYRRLAETAELWESGQAALLVDPQLQLALDWRDRAAPSESWARRYHPGFPLAMDFIEQSRNPLTEQRLGLALKRSRRTAMVLGILLLLAIGAAIFAFVGWRRALAERDHSNRLLYDDIYFAEREAAEGHFTLAQSRLDECS